MTPLYLACSRGNNSIMKVLLDHGADVSLPNDVSINSLLITWLHAIPK